MNEHTEKGNQACDLDALLDGCRRQDRLCQEKLYMLFFDKMFAMIRRYTYDRDKAMDILNNGFLRAFQKIEHYQHSGSFEGWLRRIMVHAVADYFRGSREHQAAQTTGDMPEHLHAAGEDTQSRLDYKDLLMALQQLPPTTRIVINLFIIEGYSHKEIASLLNISTGTTKWHVAEGRRLLRELIGTGRSFPQQQAGMNG